MTTADVAAPMTRPELQKELAVQRVEFARLNDEWNALFRQQGDVAVRLRAVGAYIVRLERQL